jgi:hypothetical protein
LYGLGVAKPPQKSHHGVWASATPNLGRNHPQSGFITVIYTDRSDEFQMASSESRRFPLACTVENSDELIRQLVLDLEYCSIEEQRQAVMEIRLLAKYDWAILFIYF